MAAGDNDAGRLRERVSLAKRVEQDDGAGNTVADWVEQFQCAAGFVHLKGGETVMAARLTNKHPMVARVRSSVASRAATADWRLTDVRTGRVYAIRDVTVGREWVDLLVEGGVAA